MSSAICPPLWAPGILADHQIKHLVETSAMIRPFSYNQVKNNGIISYGLSSYGYDVRISDQFKIINQDCTRGGKIDSEKAFAYRDAHPDILWSKEYEDIITSNIIDPTEFDESVFVDYQGSEIIIPPHGFALGTTMETIDVPKDVMVIALGRSTWNRCGLIVGITPLEAGWTGTVTMEMSNTTDLPIRVKAGHGICQLLFFKGSMPCEVSYADRAGKYQNQSGVTTPKVVKE